MPQGLNQHQRQRAWQSEPGFVTWHQQPPVTEVSPSHKPIGCLGAGQPRDTGLGARLDGCPVTSALSALCSGEQQSVSLSLPVCLPSFSLSPVSPLSVSPFSAVMMLAQQAGPLEREAEETTFHSWPAAPHLHPSGLPAWHHPSSRTDPHLHRHRQHAGRDGASEVPAGRVRSSIVQQCFHFLRGVNVPGLVPVPNRPVSPGISFPVCANSAWDHLAAPKPLLLVLPRLGHGLA